MHETVYISGDNIDKGTYACTNCGYKIKTQTNIFLPRCPQCDNYEFTKEKD